MPYRTGADSPRSERRGPTVLGIALIVLCVIGIVGGVIWSVVRGNTSPELVRTELRATRRDYVGTWNAKGTRGSVSLRIEATGDVYYDESSAYRESKGEKGNLEVESNIKAFDGDDITFLSGRRIKVTSPPQKVGDHFEMKADGMSFQRE